MSAPGPVRRALAGGAALGFAGALVLAAAPTAGADAYDLEKGDYLTAEEYKKLSKDEALEYCQKLAQEIDIQNDNAAAANAQMADIDAEIASLRARLAEARGASEPLASEVADLERRLKELTELPRSYEVVPGDWLIKISAKARIYSDERQWRRIYRANRDKIRDPNLIYPGQVLLIPRADVASHRVADGETLRRIAGYPEIYGDASQWQRIWEANKDRVPNPDVLPAGIDLAIPR